MSGRYSVTCSHCAFAQSFGAPPCVYALPGGESMRIPDGFAWCQACDSVTRCETLPALTDLERLLDEARREADQDFVLELERTKAWLGARISPARCLDCASTHILAFPLGWSIYQDEESDEDFHDIPHPDCSGMLHVESYALSLYQGEAAQYSPEGERIPDA